MNKYDSESDLYYDQYCRTGLWSHPEVEHCGCRGTGYWLSDLDTWHECRFHHDGQPHPEVNEDDYSFMDEVNENDDRDMEAIGRGDLSSIPVIPADLLGDDDSIPF